MIKDISRWVYDQRVKYFEPSLLANICHPPPKPRPGKPIKTSAKTDALIKHAVKQKPFITSTAIRKVIQNIWKHRGSYHTWTTSTAPQLPFLPGHHETNSYRKNYGWRERIQHLLKSSSTGSVRSGKGCVSLLMRERSRAKGWAPNLSIIQLLDGLWLRRKSSAVFPTEEQNHSVGILGMD